MKIERTKNASRNLLSGTILKIYQLIVPFIMRTVVVYFLGIQYLGLNSLFYSVLQVLNMAELGVSGAITFSMYRPIAEDDTETICSLMRLYKIYYRIIGTVILVIGLCVIPFLTVLISNEVPDGINIYVLYLLNLAATVLSYWLFAYKTCLLNAHQRVDVTNKVMLVTNTIQYLLQIFVLAVFRNYYYYVVIALMTQAVTNIGSAIITRRMYPSYNAYGVLPRKSVKKINGRIKDMFTAKIASTFIGSVDTLVISSFLGLTVLAIYNNYTYISVGISGLLGVVYSSCSAGIGNSLVVETQGKNYSDLIRFTFIIAWIAGYCTICLFCLYQPFMVFWMGNENVLEFKVVICICINYFFGEIARLLSTYKDVAGMWHEDRFRPLTITILNLILNLLFVHHLGIFGIILATSIVGLAVNVPWLLANLFNKLFKGYLKDYLKHLTKYLLIIIGTGVVCYKITGVISGETLGIIILKGVICTIIINALFFICYFRCSEFKSTYILGKRVLRNILGRK